MLLKSRYSLKLFNFSSHKIIANILEKGNFQNILDVGCDLGFLGQVLNYRPKNLIGIDKRRLPKLPNYSRVWQADINTTDFDFLKKQQFEVIILADILEHLENPANTINKLKPFLKNKGIFIISLPNMGFFLSSLLSSLKIRPKMKQGLFDSTHKHDFTYQSVRNFLKSCDLVTIKITPSPIPLPIISAIFNKGGKLYKVYQLIYSLTKKMPSIFAYQTIVVCLKK